MPLPFLALCVLCFAFTFAATAILGAHSFIYTLLKAFCIVFCFCCYSGHPLHVLHCMHFIIQIISFVVSSQVPAPLLALCVFYSACIFVCAVIPGAYTITFLMCVSICVCVCVFIMHYFDLCSHYRCLPLHVHLCVFSSAAF